MVYFGGTLLFQVTFMYDIMPPKKSIYGGPEYHSWLLFIQIHLSLVLCLAHNFVIYIGIFK